MQQRWFFLIFLASCAAEVALASERDYVEAEPPRCFWVTNFPGHVHQGLKLCVERDRAFFSNLQRKPEDGKPSIRAGYGNFAAGALEINGSVQEIDNPYTNSLTGFESIKSFTTLRSTENVQFYDKEATKASRALLLATPRNVGSYVDTELQLVTTLLSGHLGALLSLHNTRPVETVVLHIYTEHDPCGWCADMLADFAEAFNCSLRMKARHDALEKQVKDEIAALIKKHGAHGASAQAVAEALYADITANFKAKRSPEEFAFSSLTKRQKRELKLAISGSLSVRKGTKRETKTVENAVYPFYMREMQKAGGPGAPNPLALFIYTDILMANHVAVGPAPRFSIYVSSSERHLYARRYGCDFLLSSDVIQLQLAPDKHVFFSRTDFAESSAQAQYRDSWANLWRLERIEKQFMALQAQTARGSNMQKSKRLSAHMTGPP